jgi:hypothetical protein
MGEYENYKKRCENKKHIKCEAPSHSTCWGDYNYPCDGYKHCRFGYRVVDGYIVNIMTEEKEPIESVKEYIEKDYRGIYLAYRKQEREEIYAYAIINSWSEEEKEWLKGLL